MVQTELHRHLDASLRLSTLFQLAQTRGLEPSSTSLDSFREKFILSHPLTSLNEVLSKFKLFQQVLDRPEVLTQVAFEVIEDCYQEGTRKVELRFSPGFISEFNQMSWETILDAFERGRDLALALYPEMKVGFLCIASRDYGVDSVDETVEFFLKYKTRFVGLDLAGNEEDFPCKLFEKSFQKAVKHKLNITVHAGEACGPENIWSAIEFLGANRIGHGISCVKDLVLMKYLAEKQICLEMCPTSNWITRAVLDLSEHPIKKAINSGIPVSINTDDPGIFGVTMSYEENICTKIVGISSVDLDHCRENAAKFSFIK